MYGLVNKAIQGLVTQRKGSQAWTRIIEETGSTSTFISMETYPDSVSFALVGAAAQELGVDAAAFLRELGYYWVTYTGAEGYGDMFNLWGDDLRSFLKNLDLMHERVKSTMPQLEPPSFTTVDQPDGRIRLSYFSHREGMTPMVLGLLEGLAVKFSTPMSVEHLVHRVDAGHDEFLLTFTDA
jgi:hypothetical protein